jgi:hypothetical protein
MVAWSVHTTDGGPEGERSPRCLKRRGLYAEQQLHIDPQSRLLAPEKEGTGMGIAYATREDVISSLAYNESARTNAAADRAVQAASRSVESLLRRRFYPSAETRSFANVWGNRFWLDESEVISVSAIEENGVLRAAAGYRLDPTTGPPYTSIYADDGFTAARFGEDLDVTGVFGYANVQRPAGSLAAAIATAGAATITVSDGSLVGVGDLLTIDSERLQVTGRAWTTSAQTGSITASNADRTLAVATGSAFSVGEYLLIDAERVLIEDIAGNNLIVKRAQGGSVLAVHTTATIYVSRVLTVERGVTGTTAATHLISTAITALAPPALVRSLTIAEAVNLLLQESGGYSRETGSGETTTTAPGVGLDALRKQARDALGRKVRAVAI